MNVLLVKTSSLGDVVHLLPAVTEAVAARPELRLHWLVEADYAEIPAWHRGIERVIPVGFRRWRGRRLAMLRSREWATFRERLAHQRYDRVIDAQGLIKSAWLASRAHGPRCGPDRVSAREPLAALSYHERLAVPTDLHAVERLRRLLAGALGYALQPSPPGYGLESRLAALRRDVPAERVLLLHGSSWPNKRWPVAHWSELGRRLRAAGLIPTVAWGDRAEQAIATRIATACEGEVLPRLALGELLTTLAGARAVVGVDSGLLHLAAAAGVPGLGLFGPTDPRRTGTWGGHIVNLAAPLPCVPCRRRRCHSSEAGLYGPDGEALEPPCLARLRPERVWAALEPMLEVRAMENGAGS